MTNCSRARAGAGFRYTFLTQKERDIETNLDYFLARYYSSTQGRFTSPDEFTGGPDELYYFVDDASDNPTFYADLRNPQSLNKYNYSYNNPLRYVDPDGHDPDEEVETPDPPQGQGRSASGTSGAPVFPRGPGPTPQEAQQTVEALERLNRAIDDALLPIRQIIGTSPAGTIDPIVTAPTVPVPIPTTETPPSQQSQPLPPPAPIQSRKQVFKNFPTRKSAIDARPRPQPAKPGEDRVTRQSKNKAGMGTKSEKHKQGGTHVHDDRHNKKKKPNVHYGFPD